MVKDFFTKIGDIALSYSQNETIRRMAEAGRSANDIQKQLQSQGIGMKRQSVQQATAYYKGLEQQKETWKYTPKKYGISDEKHEVSRKTLDTKYKYTVQVDVSSNSTGLNTKRYVTIKSDRKMTVGELEQQAEDALAKTGALDKYKEDIQKVTLYRAIKQGQ